MRELFRKLVRDETGQDLAEYGVALAIIGLGAGVAAVGTSVGVNSLWSTALSCTTMALSP